ncbi:MAG TPA: hypothetical protein VLT36_21385, partial [Candidatus Dormibacteraeota bacterium]|nr:hypothetical protein [Candidatus Dormibacteraeota bacterium]
MKKLLLICLTLASLPSAFAFPTFDPFADATASGGTTYLPGVNLGSLPQRNALGDRWYNVNSTTTAANLTYLTNVSLSFPGLPALGGGSFVLRNVQGPGARMFVATSSAGFISISSPGTAYYSLLMKVVDVTHLSTAGDFAWGFNNQGTISDQTSQPSDLHARVYLKKNGSGYQVGFAKTTTITFDSTVHTTNETLFLVASYQVNPGTATDDVAQLWINPSASSFGASGPAAPATIVPANTDADEATFLSSFTIENRSTTMADLLLMDDFRMGTNWSWVTGGPGFRVVPVGSTNVLYSSNFSLSFLPLANGTATTYQWQKDGINLVDGPNVAGSTTTNLIISNAVAGGTYSAIINGLGSVTNSTLVTIINPWFVQQPANTNAGPGGTVTFSALGIGTPSMSYRWQQNGTDLNDGVDGAGTTVAGSHTATLALSTIALGDGGSSYTCALTNGTGSGAISSAATLTVN